MIENNTNSIENKILQKIKDENLQPRSLWYFLIRDYSLWSLVFISIILAALSISPIIFTLQNLEPGYIKHITNNIFFFVIDILPYPWIILCAATTYFATLAWEKTKHGYRFDGKKVFAISFLSSLALGIILNLWDFGRAVDNEFRNASMGNYKSFEERRNEFWFNPDQGRIIGVVKEVGTTTFIIQNDSHKYVQEISFDNKVSGKENVVQNNNIRIVGYFDLDDNIHQSFIACAIFPDRFQPSNPATLKKRKPDPTTTNFPTNLATHEECEKIFEQGRANFHPRLLPRP
jgi:hypothetical protein